MTVCTARMIHLLLSSQHQLSASFAPDAGHVVPVDDDVAASACRRTKTEFISGNDALDRTAECR
ncbi:MAG: hypothetical protein E6K82_03175 [Candidatus Rokuibacteriota bacterium]|nr:MAG: hypothetical protein E6K82_03175 [Candidatus Rokubacteria bacterium]